MSEINTIPTRQQLARKRISKIEDAVIKAVDNICTATNYQTTYAEINAGLLRVMTTFNGHELQELWKPKRSDKNKAELKEYVAIRDWNNELKIWKTTEYNQYVSKALGVGAGPAVLILATFDKDENFLFPDKQKGPSYDEFHENITGQVKGRHED